MVPYRRVPPGVHPPEDPAYRSTVLRHPLEPLVQIPQTISEITGPSYPYDVVGPVDNDLTRQHAAAPIGERIIVEGRVLDGNGGPLRARSWRFGRPMRVGATHMKSTRTTRRSIQISPERAGPLPTKRVGIGS